MIHPDTELRFINHEIGYGVVATKRIPRGSITWVKDKLDRAFTSEEIHKLDELYQNILSKYTFRDRQGNHILCWDNARFVNHSYDSNCVSTAYDFELAVRDIEAGQELTDDYGYLNLTEPFEALPEKRSKRKRVNPDDLVHFHEYWDRKLRHAFKQFPKVEQPLQKLLAPELVEKCIAIANGKAEMDSILTTYYSDASNS